jgi:hypothetical protein
MMPDLVGKLFNFLHNKTKNPKNPNMSESELTEFENLQNNFLKLKEFILKLC